MAMIRLIAEKVWWVPATPVGFYLVKFEGDERTYGCQWKVDPGESVSLQQHFMKAGGRLRDGYYSFADIRGGDEPIVRAHTEKDAKYYMRFAREIEPDKEAG